MSSSTPNRRRRFLTIFSIVAFVAMCLAIGVSELWAYYVNVPHYKAAGHTQTGGRSSQP
ncbi:MAG TPA: hypothetical protein VGF98_13440 [Candidatus Tumulicola sp.]